MSGFRVTRHCLLMSLLKWSRLSLGRIQGRRSHVEIGNSPSLASHRFFELCSIFIFGPISGSPDEPSVYG